MVFGSDSAKVTNPFFPLALDVKVKHAGKGRLAGYRHYYQILKKEVVDAVECVKVVQRGYGNHVNPDLDPQWYYLWLAQDTSGVVWLLKEYDALTNTDRTLGRASAVVWLPAQPVRGQRFAQNGSGYREVVETDVTLEPLSTGLGPYTGSLKIKWTDGSSEDFFYFAPNVGIVKEEWIKEETTDGWEVEEIGKTIKASHGLIANYGATYGLWHYDQVRGWTRLNTVNPDQMVAIDVDDDGVEELVSSFAGYGLYLYKESSGWSRLNEVIPGAMKRLGSGVVADYGATYGLWYWDLAGGWKRWNTVAPDSVLAVDLDNDGREDLLASYSGYGLWSYNPVTQVWTRINTSIPDAMIRLGNGIACNYGPTYGLWYWDLAGGWKRWNTVAPDAVLAVDLDNDGREDLLASYSGYGLWSYNPVTQVWTRINTYIPDAFAGINLINY
jgi:hypothetical protein